MFYLLYSVKVIVVMTSDDPKRGPLDKISFGKMTTLTRFSYKWFKLQP